MRDSTGARLRPRAERSFPAAAADEPLSRSLSATFMRNRIVGSLRSSGDPELTKAAGAVSQNFVFEYPSIRELASAVAACWSPASTLVAYLLKAYELLKKAGYTDPFSSVLLRWPLDPSNALLHFRG